MLEAKAAERTAELKANQEKSDAQLGNILPAAIIEKLNATGVAQYCGKLAAKDKGEIGMYFVLRERPPAKRLQATNWIK